MAAPAPGLITITHANHHQTLINGLWNMFLAKHGVDFVVNECGPQIRAHSLILSLFLSPHELLNNVAAAGPEPEQQRVGDDRGELDALLEFLYRGTVTVRKGQLENLLRIAKKSNFKMLVAALGSAVMNSPDAKPYKATTRRPAYDDGAESHQSSDRTSGFVEQWDSSQFSTNSRLGAGEADYIGESSAETDIGSCLLVQLEEEGIIDPIGPTFEDRRGVKRKLLDADMNADAVEGEEASSVDWNFAGKKMSAKPRLERANCSYKCNTCPKSSMTRDELINHAPTHWPRSPYDACHVCGEQYTQSSSFAEHAKLHAGGQALEYGDAGRHSHRAKMKKEEEKFSCQTCHRTFDLKKTLIIHNWSHSKYTCDICELEFSNREVLAAHVSTHKGRKPFKCAQPLCNRSFAAKSGLVMHLRAHAANDLLEEK